MPAIANKVIASSIEFIQPDEAILRLEKISSELKSRLSLLDNGQDRYLAIYAYRLAVDAHIDFLSGVNDKEFFTPVAWDRGTNLPSHPSMAADIASIAKRNSNPLLKGILESFSRWTPIFRENFDCACGSGSKFEKVSWCILLNHVMSEKDGELTVKQFLAAIPEKPEYMEKLKAHHQPNKISQADDRFIIISECINAITNSQKASVRAIEFWASKQVNIVNLQNLFDSFLQKNMEASAV